MPTAGWWEALWPDPAAVLKAVGLKPGMRVVDLCSGDGWFTLQIAKIAREVIAIDIDPQLLEITGHRLAENGAGNVQLVAGDACQLPQMIVEPVDYVFMSNAFHGVPDRLRLATAVRRVLKPEGEFAFVNWHPRPREETTVSASLADRGPTCGYRQSKRSHRLSQAALA